MATIQEIAEIKAHDWGFPFDQMVIEKVKKLVIPYMSTIIQRRYDQTHKFPTSLIHTIKCVDLVFDECSGLNGVLLKRTDIKIPSPIITKSNSNFIYVGELNFRQGFSNQTPESINSLQYKKFVSKKPYYFYEDNYIWVGNAKHLKKIAIRYVPNNPLELQKIKDVEGGVYRSDGDFEIEPSLMDGIMSLLDRHRVQIITPDLKPEIRLDEI